MVIYSELTKQKYDTVEDCVAAEKEFKEKQEQKEKEKALLAEKKKERAQEVVNSYQKIREAEKEYLALRNQFVKDYGSFHFSYMNEDSEIIKEPFDFFDVLNKFFK